MRVNNTGEYVFIGVGILPTVGPQPTREDAELFAALVRTPEGRRVLDYLQQPGAGPQMGAWKIFKKIGGAIKKIGKITRPFTTALAKTFIPSSVVNALAKADPTAGNKLQSVMSKALPAAQKAFATIPTALVPTTQTLPAVPAGAGFFSKEKLPRNLLIFGGITAVVVGGMVFFRRPARVRGY